MGMSGGIRDRVRDTDRLTRVLVSVDVKNHKGALHRYQSTAACIQKEIDRPQDCVEEKAVQILSGFWDDENHEIASRGQMAAMLSSGEHPLTTGRNQRREHTEGQSRHSR